MSSVPSGFSASVPASRFPSPALALISYSGGLWHGCVIPINPHLPPCWFFFQCLITEAKLEQIETEPRTFLIDELLRVEASSSATSQS